MTNIIAGYFSKKDDYKKLESDLNKAGFDNKDFTVFLSDETDTYLTSVNIKDEAEAKSVKEVFGLHHVSASYFFENLESPSFEVLKKMIEERAKTEVSNAPGINADTSDSEGIDDEVTFGK